MKMLCGYHSKSREICEWVVKNVSLDTDNITVRQWVIDSMEQLKSLNDGPDPVSTEQ